MSRFSTFFLSSVMLLILASSCSLELNEAPKPFESNAGGIQRTITVVSQETKTSMSYWEVTWKTNDTISVFYSSFCDNAAVTEHSKFTYQGDGTFTGNFYAPFIQPYNWYAVYDPQKNYKYDVKNNDITLTVYHPSSINQTQNYSWHIAKEYDPLIGYVTNCPDNPNMKFNHIASAIDFKIKNTLDVPIKITSVRFTAPSPISGKFKAIIDLTDPSTFSPQWTPVDGTNYVTVTPKNNVEMQSDKSSHYYMAIHPVSGNGEYTIRVNATFDGEPLYSERSINKDMTFSAGSLKTIDYDFVQSIPEKSYDIENSRLKAYLDRMDEYPYFTTNDFVNWDGHNTYGTTTNMLEEFYSGNDASHRFDQPNPVVLNWDGIATSLVVYSDEARSDAVQEFSFKRGRYASIYNLIPGHKYYYSVSNNEGELSRGNFIPDGRRRMMRVSTTYANKNACNCRDLGGLPTNDGHQLKYGLIYRGSNIDGILSDSEMLDVFVNDMGIRLDVDLRLNSQKTSAPDLSSYGITRTQEEYDSNVNDSNLLNRTKMKATLENIMESVIKDEPVYIHCSVGADRTGYVCLLIEALLGVRQNACDTDFEMSSFTTKITSTPRLRTKPVSGGTYSGCIKNLAKFNGSTLGEKAYDYIVTSSNGLGINADLVEQFRAKMIQ